MRASGSFAADSSVAPGRVPLTLGGRRSVTGRTRQAISWLEQQALFVAGLALLAGVVLGRVPSDINQDGWLALVDGRYVAEHGVPHADTFGAITHGVRWIDQQWLAQLLVYALHQVGGMALYSIGYVALTFFGFSIAIAAARRLGATEAHVLRVLPVAAFLYFIGSLQIRTQGFAYPLFASTLWLLAAEAGKPRRRRVYLVFPLIVLWANLHGSACLGAGLAVLYGVCLLGEDLRSDRPRHVSRRSLAFIIGPPLCLLATPYGLAGLNYYNETVLNPAFKSLVVEWQPITSFVILAVPFFVTSLATLWGLGRNWRRIRLFEAMTLLVLIAAAISAARNITWFGLAVMMLLPSIMGRNADPRSPAPRRVRFNLALVGASTVFLLGSLVSVAVKPSSWFERNYDARALRTVTAAVHHEPAIRIYASGHFADWLLWHEPSLAGHLAYDSRLELLTSGQLRELADLTAPHVARAREFLAGYRLLVLETPSRSTRLLLAEPGTHIILRGRNVTVASRSGTR